MRTYITLIIAVALLAGPGRELSAQNSEVIHGKVLDTQKKPIADVDVTITGASGVAVHATSNAKGQYTAVFREAEGNYVLAFRKVGYGNFARTIKAEGASNGIEVPDVLLPGGYQVLQPLVATTTRRVPSRGEQPSVGAAEANLGTLGLFTIDPGDLNALTALLPGITSSGDSGVSVLGASPGQNKVIVDGADFASTKLPRDAIARVRVVTNTFDASKGQFAGAETVVSTRGGTDFFASTLRVQLTDPHLSWDDPSAPVPVPRTGYFSGYLSGPLVGKKVTYMASFDASDRVSNASSLLAPRDELLSQLGVSRDSIDAVTQSLTALHVPLASGASGSGSGFRSGSAIIRTDVRLNAFTSFTFSATGNWARGSGSGISELAYPSVSGQSASSLVRYQLTGGTYIRRVLGDFSVSYTPQSSSVSPYVALPAASVLVSTLFPSGQTGLTSFRFGGGGQASKTSGSTFDVSNEVTWWDAKSRDQIKVAGELRFDRSIVSQNVAAPGMFAYQTLADLAINHPSLYTRTLSTGAVASAANVVALSVGNIYRLIPGKFELQGGVRYDGRTFGSAPSFNPDVESQFGVHTSVVPSDQALSPRLGFSWTPGARRSNVLPDGMVIISANGGGGARASRTPLDAAGLALLADGSRVKISGGIGAYHGTISSTRIGALVDATGLPSTTRYLGCVGSAVPVPNWSDPAAATFSQCADGANAVAFASTTPRVTVFDPDFRAPTSWRGLLQLAGFQWHKWAIAPQFTWSAGTNVESWQDLNLVRTPQFQIGAEGNRPVFAPASSIVPATGLIAPNAASVSNAFGRVAEYRSDLQYHAAQLLVAAAPLKPLFGKLPLYVVYGFNDQRRQQRGFSGTTSGDPFSVESTDGDESHHQVIVGLNGIRIWWLALAVRLNVQSGVRYTPVVSGDINGDGLANDRAFIATSSQRPDSALDAQMSALLAAAPNSVRRCLMQQSGEIAAAGSCQTPWRGEIDLNLALVPPQTIGSGSRLHVTTTILNAGGALVRLLGLSRTPFGQSSASASVDPRLLYVTGFDPVNRKFKYRVNQLFGQPIDFGSARNRYPPFQVQLGVEYRLGYPSTAQTARNIGVFPNGQDSATVAARVRSDLLRRTSANPIAPMLQWRDSLALTQDQLSSIEHLNQVFVQQADSLMNPVIAFFIARGKKLTSDEYNARILVVGPSLRAIAETASQQATAFLLPEQRIKLDELTRTMRRPQ